MIIYPVELFTQQGVQWIEPCTNSTFRIANGPGDGEIHEVVRPYGKAKKWTIEATANTTVATNGKSLPTFRLSMKMFHYDMGTLTTLDREEFGDYQFDLASFINMVQGVLLRVDTSGFSLWYPPR